MRRLRNLAIVFVAALAVAATAALAWLWRLDVEDYRATIEESVAEATGRRLTLRGAMHLALGWRPRLVIEDAALANAAWAATPEMARVGALEVEVEALPWLLGGEVRVRRMVIRDSEVTLERDAHGRRNWQNEAENEEPDPEAPATFDALTALVGEILVERTRVSWIDGTDGERLPLEIERLAVLGASESRATIRGRGRWHEQPFDVHGSLGPIDALGAGRGTVEGELRGTIAPFGDFSAEGTLEKDADRSRVDLRLRSERFSIPWAEQDRSVADNVFSAAPLPLEALRSFDGRFEVSAAHLGLRAAEARDVAFVVTLEQGKLRIDPLRARFGAGEMTGNLSLDVSQTPALATLALSAEDLDFESLVAAAGLPGRVRDGRGRFAVELRGRGDSPAAIAASVEGEAKLLAGRGRVRTDAIDSLVIGPDRVLGKLVDEDERYAEVACAAADLTFAKGVGKPEVLLIDTPRATLVGEGEINLALQTIHLEIVPSPKLVRLSVGVPLTISGKLTRPRVHADELGVVKRLGGLFTIAVFPPAALQSLSELDERENPCLVLASGGRPRGDSGVVAAARQTGEGVVGTIGGGAKKIGDALEGLLGR